MHIVDDRLLGIGFPRIVLGAVRALNTLYINYLNESHYIFMQNGVRGKLPIMPIILLFDLFA